MAVPAVGIETAMLQVAPPKLFRSLSEVWRKQVFYFSD